MANGTEIWFGYTYPEYHEKAPPVAPRVPWPLPTDGSEDGPKEDWPDAMYAYSQDAALVYNPLEAAWVAACLEAGWEVGKCKKPAEKLRYYPVRTPAGRWEFSPFRLDYQYGGEMGFDFPGVPVGVPLSGRYFPTFLDYENRSGTLPNPFILDDPAAGKLAQVAKKHIVSALPWLQAGKLMIVELHY